MFGDETLCRILHSVAGVAKLVDAPGLGPDAVKACRFESDLPHQTQESEFSEMRFGFFILNPDFPIDIGKGFNVSFSNGIPLENATAGY